MGRNLVPGIATHYFAGFVVVPEAALLLSSHFCADMANNGEAAPMAAGRDGHRRRGRDWALLLPIALRQAGNAHAGWIAEQPLSERLERAGAKLVGDDNGDEHGARQPGPIPLGDPGGAGAGRRWRCCSGAAGASERRGGAVAAMVGVAGIAAAARCSAPSAPTTSTGATCSRSSCP